MKSEIIKEKVKRIIRSNDRAKIEFLMVVASHNGFIMFDSMRISFKRFNEKYGERKFEEVKNDLIDEGIIFTSPSGGIQLAVKKEGYYDSQTGEELCRFIGKLIFKAIPEIKKTVENLFEEPEGKEFLRHIAEKGAISTLNGQSPEIIEIIGKRSYEKILNSLLEVGILTEYSWSSRKHYYQGYNLLPSVETYLKERLSPFELSAIENELKAKGLKSLEIYVCFEVLRKIYLAQNIRSEGVLQDDFSEYVKEIELLTRYEFIKENRWSRFDLFLTTEKGSKTGKLLVEKLIKDKQAQITSAVLNLPHNLIGFLFFDYMSQLLTYSVEKEYIFDWREPLLADSRIWILRNKLLRELENLGLYARTRSYVSTRGGELRGEFYVTCKEVLNFLKDCTACTGGLFGRKKKVCLLYDFFRRVKRFLQIENIDEVRERYYSIMEELKLTEEEIEEIVNEMTRISITDKYSGLLSDTSPFSIKDESRYDIYLKEQLIKPVIHFLLEKPKREIDVEAEGIAEERLEEVRKVEREKMKNLGLVSREERIKLYCEIADFELELRQFIEKELRGKFGDLWLDKSISENVRKRWDKRKEGEESEGIEPESEIMNYADFGDYKEIIIHDWDIFEPCFKDKETLKVRLLDLNLLGRRPVMHIRTINEEKVGVARYAISWLRSRVNSFRRD